jgi:hypothetical protein
MSDPRNIQIFQELAARILDRLYREFPNPCLLNVSAIGHEVSELLQSPEEENFRIVLEDSANSMSFLIKEGFVAFSPSRRTLDQPATVFPEAVLTLKGFTLLGAVPSAVDETVERRPIAQQLSEALNGGARGAVGELIKKLFFGAMSLGVSSLGG